MNKSIVKLIVSLPSESVEGVREHAVEHGITMTESIRRALGLQHFFDKEVSKGTKILIEGRRGDYRQLMV